MGVTFSDDTFRELLLIVADFGVEVVDFGVEIVDFTGNFTLVSTFVLAEPLAFMEKHNILK